MARYDLHDFVRSYQQTNKDQGLFELERDRVLEVNLQGDVWTKTGSMIVYLGAIKFVREGFLDQGVVNLMKRFVSREKPKMTKASGYGKLYLADSGKRVNVKTFFGRGSGESLQMKFQGEGFVVVQPIRRSTHAARTELTKITHGATSALKSMRFSL
jgi:uncharacterized protein (AIM24 family)